MVISQEDLAGLSVEERAVLVTALLELGTVVPDGRRQRRRQQFIVFVLACTVGLAAWIVALGLTLPAHETVEQWRLAWIGFDVAELAAFAITGWAAWRARPILIPATIVTGTLLLCDAWFDVVLSWNTSGRWQSLASAIVLEVPLALLFWLAARRATARGLAAVTTSYA
jgi:hypothetical protein